MLPFFNVKKTLLLLLILIPLLVFPQFYNTEIEAKIDLNEENKIIEISSAAINKTEINQSLRYVLSVIKSNAGNVLSRNKQEGRVVLKSGEKKFLSSTSINSSRKDKIIILLLIYNLNDVLKGKDRVVLNEQDLKENKSNVQEKNVKKNDGISLKGIVLEDTKTKPGRDFYKMFYSSYMRNNINGNKIVSIKETLTVGSNTMIKIMVGEKNILEFYIRPQNEYLKAMNNEAIRRVYKYFQKLEQQKETVKYY